MGLSKKILGTKIGEKILQILDKTAIEALAKETGFVKRESSLGGFDFALLQMKTTASEGYMSLTELISTLYQDTGIVISKQGLDGRYNEEAVNFLKKLLGKVLLINLKEKISLPTLSQFKGICVRDATSSQIPACLVDSFKGSGGSGSNAGVKIDLMYDILGSDMVLEFRDAASNDTSSQELKVRLDHLYLQDLGYFKLPTFAHIDSQGGYFISRYKQGVNIYHQKEDKKAILIGSLLEGLQENQTKEYNLFLGSKNRLPVRLIIQKLPQHITDKRKKRLKKELKGKKEQASKQRIFLCGYTLIITNIKQELIASLEILELYRLRWQIEIMFKCWKSILDFGQVHPMKAQRFLCMLYGQMIWITLTMKLTSLFRIVCWKDYRMELSELKFFKIIYIAKNKIWEAIQSNFLRKLKIELQKLSKMVFLFAEKEIKKNRINILFDEI